jgi:hypothetical protein
MRLIPREPSRKMGCLTSVFSATCGLTAVVFTALACVGCEPCENTLLYSVPSPNKNMSAVVFVRSCGATTGFGTHVSLLPGFNESARGAGNVFVADSNHGIVREGRSGEIPIRVEWLSKDTLRIVYPLQARVFRAENSVSGIAVSYSY